MPDENINEMLHLYKIYMDLMNENFFEYVFLSYRWWILVILLVTLWIVWAFLVDKKRVLPILFVGLITSLIAVTLDDIGLNLILWDYPYRLAYFTSRMDIVNMAILPVSYMLVYQYVRTWKMYVFVLAVLSIFGATIAEPLFVDLRYYIMMDWEFRYSIPFYIAIGIFAKLLVDKLVKDYAK